MKYKIRSIFIFLWLFAVNTLFGQDSLKMKFITWDVLLSPVVHADKSVTFQLKAPDAREVSVAISGRQKIGMTKNEDGVWSVTIGTMEADVYPYRFVLDRVNIIDPANPEVTGGHKMTAGQSLLTVPDDAPKPWEFKDVPHGTISTHYYN